MREIYLDIETERWSEEVEGGWSNIPAFGFALAVTWEQGIGNTVWVGEGEAGARGLIKYLQGYDRIITFNGERFDFKVLSAYGDVSALYEKSFDSLAQLTRTLGHRVSLDSLARATLHRGKTGDGLEAVRWWRSGDPELRQRVMEYCRRDVDLLRDLVSFGRQRRFLLFHDRQGDLRRVDYVE